MEKFSNFADPLTGRNPFSPRPIRKKSDTNKILSVLIFFKHLIALILIRFGIWSMIKFVLEIKILNNSEVRTKHKNFIGNKEILSEISKKNKIICNSVSLLDQLLLKCLFPTHKIVYTVSDYKKFSRAIFFIEECRSNGQMLVKFKEHVPCEMGLIFKYNNDCVYLNGSRLRFWINLCSQQNSVNIETYDISHSRDLPIKSGILHSQFGFREKLLYVKAMAEYKRNKLSN